MSYNHEASRDRVKDILSSKTEIVKKDRIPSSDDEFTYLNGIKSWVGAIFIDLVDSSRLCETADEKTARADINRYSQKDMQRESNLFLEV